MKTAIFLGAGASAAEGAPLQSNIFKDYFKSIQGNLVRHKMEKELAIFFRLVFSIDVNNDDLDRATFPTFEEVLGVIDFAEKRRESLRRFPLENISHNSYKISRIRQYLVLLMAKIIHDKLIVSTGIHNLLVRNLYKNDLLKDTVFITTNYDILIDNALSALYRDHQLLLDYGVEFTNYRRSDEWKSPDNNAVKLFKLHGSLNWLFCPTCNELTLTPKEKGVIRLLTDFGSSLCIECNSVMVPIIVPPTFIKDMSNVYLGIVNNKAEISLRNVEHLIFCGYSFPDADMHIKYLMKRIQTNRSNNLRISIINHHKGKQKTMADAERMRFKRFLGNCDYLTKTFENFAKKPNELYVSKSD